MATIRTAVPADIEAVLDLWRRGRSTAAVTPDRPEALLGAIDLGALLVAETDGHLAGSLVAGWDGWRGNIYRLVVDERLRRRGVGRALVERAEERLRGLGAPRISVIVGREEEAALAFWEAVGYARDGNTARYVRNLP